jgi:hypothetical protein
MTQYYVYRGVKYAKAGNKNTTVKHDRIERVYRGIGYLQLPSLKRAVCDHVYRGSHYMA